MSSSIRLVSRDLKLRPLPEFLTRVGRRRRKQLALNNATRAVTILSSPTGCTLALQGLDLPKVLTTCSVQSMQCTAATRSSLLGQPCSALLCLVRNSLYVIHSGYSS